MRKRKSLAAECRRQSLVLHDDPHEREIVEWVERAADYTGWHP